MPQGSNSVTASEAGVFDQPVDVAGRYSHPLSPPSRLRRFGETPFACIEGESWFTGTVPENVAFSMWPLLGCKLALDAGRIGDDRLTGDLAVAQLPEDRPLQLQSTSGGREALVFAAMGCAEGYSHGDQITFHHDEVLQAHGRKRNAANVAWRTAIGISSPCRSSSVEDSN
jgi:hypothetical protein